jgi:hypothetical protein
MTDDARLSQARDIFGKAADKAERFRNGVSVDLTGPDERGGIIHAHVVVKSEGKKFQLRFNVGPNDEVETTALDLGEWPVPKCTLTSDSIESAIKDAIQWKFGLRPFDSG